MYPGCGHDADSLVPTSGDEQSRVIRIERADVVFMAGQRVSWFRSFAVCGRPQADRG